MRPRSFFLSAALAICPAGAASAAVISTFTGGDPGEGVDLQGVFNPGYAVYAGDPGETASYLIQDATFVNSYVAGGISISAPHRTPFGTPDYGASANDDALENINNFVFFSTGVDNYSVEIDAPVVVGTPYKLQLFFNEGCCDRGFDVVIEGAVEADEFNPGRSGGGTGAAQPQTVGTLITHVFTAVDNNLDVNLLATGNFPDNNPIIDAVSLEVIPEPASAGLVAALAGAILPFARRRRVR